MATFLNVGGSFVSALVLTIVAWGIRRVRAHSQDQRQGSNATATKKMGRFFCTLSPTATIMLVDKDPIPHCIIDVRPAVDAALNPLPAALAPSTVTIPEGDLHSALKTSNRWRACSGSNRPRPSPDSLLVFVADNESRMMGAASTAAQQGYATCAIVEGGFSALAAAAGLRLEAPQYINRDALAVLLKLQEAGLSQPQPGVALIDLRRPDERALYGCLPEAISLPTEHFPSAMQLRDEAAFEETFHFPRPKEDDWVILQCRSNRRSSWAACVAEDQGFRRVLVYKQGSYGWRVNPSVKAYQSYELGESPPEPEPFELEVVDEDTGLQELREIGLRV